MFTFLIASIQVYLGLILVLPINYDPIMFFNWLTC